MNENLVSWGSDMLGRRCIVPRMTYESPALIAPLSPADQFKLDFTRTDMADVDGQRTVHSGLRAA